MKRSGPQLLNDGLYLILVCCNLVPQFSTQCSDSRSYHILWTENLKDAQCKGLNLLTITTIARNNRENVEWY